MLILNPDITIRWDKGPILHAHSFLYVKTSRLPTDINLLRFRGTAIHSDKPISVRVLIYSIDNVVVNDDVLKHIPGAMDAINNWIHEHHLIDQWREQAATYKQVLESVDLPPLVPIERGGYNGSLEYTVVIDGQGELDIPPLEVLVIVNKAGATAQLQLLTDHYDEYGDELTCIVCKYTLPLPVTMDGIKAKVRGTLQQYMNAL